MEDKVFMGPSVDAVRQPTLAETIRQEARYLREKAYKLDQAADLFERLPGIIGSQGEESLRYYIDDLRNRRHY